MQQCHTTTLGQGAAEIAAMGPDELHLATVAALVRMVHIVRLRHHPTQGRPADMLRVSRALLLRIRLGLCQLLRSRVPWQIRLGTLLLADFLATRIGLQKLIGLFDLQRIGEDEKDREQQEQLLLLLT